MSVDISPGAGSATLAGVTPGLAAGPYSSVPGHGALTLTRYPAVMGFGVVPAPTSVALSGHVPAFTIGPTLLPATEALTLAGHAVTLARMVPTTTGTLALVGHAPSLHANLDIGTGALTLSGHSPGATIGPDLYLNAAALTLRGWPIRVTQKPVSTTIAAYDPNRAMVIPIYGDVIFAAGYDPLALVLRAIYAGIPVVTQDVGEIPTPVITDLSIATNKQQRVLELLAQGA